MEFESDTIGDWVMPDSRVLDLGCGDGTLLSELKKSKGVKATGVEIDHESITLALASGLDVIEQNIDDGLALFSDQSFDTVVMTQTLQAVKFPHLALEEMLRVGKQGIVTFPNFAHWRCRWYLSVRGEMPVSEFMPYSWYDSPNIHFCTVKDFENLCRERNIRIIAKSFRSSAKTPARLLDGFPNWFATSALYRISR